MKRGIYCRKLLILSILLFSLPVGASTKKSVKRWRPFPNLTFSRWNSKDIPFSSFRGNPVLVFVVKTQSTQFSRLKEDISEVLPMLARKKIKTAMVLLKGSTVEAGFFLPYFIDKDDKFKETFIEKEEKRPYYYLMDSEGRVALERQDIHGSVLDISKIVHVYNEMMSRQIPAFSIKYGERTRAPDIDTKDLYGKPFKLSSYLGKKSVLIVFFSIDCYFCKKEMPLLVPLENKPNTVIIGVCSAGTKEEIGAFTYKNKISFRIIRDTDRSIFMRYKSTTTPESFLVDLEGYISYKHTGASSDLKNILNFEIDKANGINMPQNLPSDTYVGARVCRTCHPQEYGSWLGTPHSVAFSSLVKPVDKKHYEDNECLKCHVTGFGKKNGYKSWKETRYLMGVQCEICHGIGGGHSSGETTRKSKQEYKRICIGCHTPKYSLSFPLDKAYKMMKHSENEDLSHYSEEVRKRIIKVKANNLRKKLVELGIPYVGTSKCMVCHIKEYASWTKTKHSRAFEVLRKRLQTDNPKCIKCHTTGYGQEGGFKNSDKSPDMIGVGCEVCHGPGGDHVKADKESFGTTIFGLTGKCKYCTIQGMCKTCHNLKNSGCAAENREFDIDTYLPKIAH